MRNYGEGMINSVTSIRRKVDETPISQKVCRQKVVVSCYHLVTRCATGGECLSKDFDERPSGENVVNLSRSTAMWWSLDREERNGVAGKGSWRKRMPPCNGRDKATKGWKYLSRKVAHFQQVFPGENLFGRYYYWRC